jgi:chromosome segregation ATPase
MADNETIADIIAEKRQYADDLERACNEIAAEAPSLVEKMEDYKHTTIADIRREADRLEAARKSERGDCAKLREALGKLRAELWNNTVIAGKRKFELYEIADAALSSPPRNCDKYANHNDAMKAFDAFVREQGKLGFINPYTEAFKWLFAPATEKEGGKDGNE